MHSTLRPAALRFMFRRLLSGVLAACSFTVAAPLAAQAVATPTTPTTPDGARRLIARLADDSLGGRYTGSPGATAAARIIAAQMRRIGLEPVGDSAYFQRVPVFAVPATRPGALESPRLATDFAAYDTMPASQRRTVVNVVGLLRGSDAGLRDEYVIVGAHYDHIGTNAARAVDGDSIFNGADDDASGVVAMLETARQLRAEGAPRRSVIFVAFVGEENGMTGTRWYLKSPVRPLASTVADIQIEMIARPDSLAGGTGKAWLTGYERSTLGEMLAAAGVPVIQDPRPAQNFFRRSDNFPFAQAGIPAHTISSFGGHSDYHQPSDEVGTVDFAHFAAVINATARAVRIAADGPRPEWKPEGRP
ncbi:MAG: M20/M25/M40 family metallo-hydrolase [Gemmatimonadota bacterium]|nr:M20/M25/M40 family metallo-hydrolase [Gemmatimonadota bacterium]